MVIAPSWWAVIPVRNARLASTPSVFWRFDISSAGHHAVGGHLVMRRVTIGGVVVTVGHARHRLVDVPFREPLSHRGDLGSLGGLDLLGERDHARVDVVLVEHHVGHLHRLFVVRNHLTARI